MHNNGFENDEIISDRATTSNSMVASQERRKWKIDVSNQVTRVRLPIGVKLYRKNADELLFKSQVEAVIKEHEKKLRKNHGKVALNEAQLTGHILSLLDISGKCPFFTLHPSGNFTVDSNYYLEDENGTRTEVSVYVEPFLEPHKQLLELIAFSETKMESQLAQVLQDFVLDFLSRHTRAIVRQYNSGKLSLKTMIFTLRDELLALSTAYNALSTALRNGHWSHEVTLAFLSRLSVITEYAEMRPQIVKEVVGRLQSVIFAILELYFSKVFSTGEIDGILENELLFLNRSNDIEEKRNVSRQCDFWNDNIFRYVEDGVRNMRRLRDGGVLPVKRNSFSLYLRRCLPHKKGAFVKRQKMAYSFEYACEMCAKDNASLLYKQIMDNGNLGTLLNELKQVYTGFAVRELVFDLLGATRDPQKYSGIVQSFQNSLRLSGFTLEMCERWTITCESGTLEDLIIRPQLSWPYQYLIDDDLLGMLNVCLQFLMKLLLAEEALSAVRIELATTEVLSVNRYKLSHLICFIAQPLTSISELYYNHLRSMLAKHFNVMSTSSTLNELFMALKNLKCQLKVFATKIGTRTLIRETIAKLCHKADEVELRWRLGLLTEDFIGRIYKAAVQETHLLTLLTSNMHGTIFELMHPLITF